MKGYIEGRMKERDSQTARRLIYKFICEMKNDKKKKKKKKGIIVIGYRKSNDVIFKTQCLECNPRYPEEHVRKKSAAIQTEIIRLRVTL